MITAGVRQEWAALLAAELESLFMSPRRIESSKRRAA
jgi:hypothetical protein